METIFHSFFLDVVTAYSPSMKSLVENLVKNVVGCLLFLFSEGAYVEFVSVHIHC